MAKSTFSRSVAPPPHTHALNYLNINFIIQRPFKMPVSSVNVEGVALKHGMGKRML